MTSPPKYVADSILGGAVDLGDFVGSRATEAADATAEDYWPRMPHSYGPPPAHLENAVKEVGYITLLLARCKLPDKDGGSDVNCISDLLLSLETRDDITNFVLEYTTFETALRSLQKWKDFPDNDALNISSRAAALKKHWGKSQQNNPSGSREDVIYAPLLSAVPNKPEGWKLQLTDSAEAEADKYYQALKKRRGYSLRYYTAKPPMPMGWAPKDGNAWTETRGDKVRSGDLFFSPRWTPIWMDFGLASIDFLGGLEKVGMTEEERNDCYDGLRVKNEMNEMIQGRELRSEDIFRS